MFQAINTKLLIAILAAISALAALMIHARNASEQSAAAATRAAQEAQNLRLQERERNAQRDAAQKEWNEERRIADREQKNHNKNYSAKDKTWTTALP